MNLGDYKLIFVVVGLIGVLLFSAPSIGLLISAPPGERFSELYLLGPGGMAEDYPYNIAEGQEYSIYIGVGNHLGSSGYYAVRGRLLNQNDALPNTTANLPAKTEPLFEYRFCIKDNQTWQEPLTFSFSDISFSNEQSVIGTFTANNVNFEVNKQSQWDSNSTGFFYKLVFELWLYDEALDTIQFNNRFVYLRLNATRLDGT